MAQPTKLTPEAQQTLVRAIGLGATLTAACQAAGISLQTLYNWEDKAAERKQPYLALFEALQKAEGERQMRWLARIEKAASEGAWQASAWKLERIYSDQYALKSKVEVTVNVADLSDEDLDAYIDAATHQRSRALASGARTKAS
jgi:hypothetical protein